MAKVQIDFPEKVLFTTHLDVRITDLNYGNHLGNDSVLSLLHEARVRFLQHFGFSEMDLGGVGIIMSDAAIQFRREVFYGEQLEISIAVTDISRAAFDICYKVSSAGNLVALAKTGIVCYDYQARKVSAIPEVFLQRIA